MKKYRIELTEDQMLLVSNCLEDASRFAAGDCRMNHTIQNMGNGVLGSEWVQRKNNAEALLKEVKRVLLPELVTNENLSYNGTDFIGNVYQIFRTILHQLAKDNDWNNVYSSPPLPSGNMGAVRIDRVQDELAFESLRDLFLGEITQVSQKVKDVAY